MISKLPVPKATGKPKIYSVPAHLDPKIKENWTLKFGGKPPELSIPKTTDTPTISVL